MDFLIYIDNEMILRATDIFEFSPRIILKIRGIFNHKQANDFKANQFV